MTATTFADDLVRDYLLFRGFTSTLKAFEAELKTDKDKGFRVDKIVDQLCAYISSYDLSSLREFWQHLEVRVFSRLEHSFTPAVRKLEASILKLYVVNALQTGRHDKLLEFFDKVGPELHNQYEWREWFALPFIKSPEESPVFAVYLTRQWQDTLLVSLHNFLSVIFQSMPVPTLLSCEDERVRISHLQEQNDLLRQQISDLQARDQGDHSEGSRPPLNTGLETPCSSELMDDFYIIAQEVPASESQQRRIKSLFKNISSGLPTSPILGRKPNQGSRESQPNAKTVPTAPRARHKSASFYSANENKGLSTAAPANSGRPRQPSDPPLKSAQRSAGSKEERAGQPKPSVTIVTHNPGDSEPTQTSPTVTDVEESQKKSAFLLLSQEEYGEHQSAVTHCKFNSSGLVIASSDIDGVIKVWSASPTPRTLATVISKSSVLALEWANKRERLLLFGNKSGSIRLYDTKDRKTLCEIGNETNSPTRDHRIICLACSPTDPTFVCSAAGRARAPAGMDSHSTATGMGKLLLWDMKNMRVEHTLQIDPNPTIVNCCAFNHNGQLLLTGAQDGYIRLFDMHQCECIASWQAHHGETYCAQLSTDETSCYSMGSDGKFIQWSINKTGVKLAEFSLHDKVAGPFSIPGGVSSSRGSVFRPTGKLFSFDADGQHVLTCAGNAGYIYKLNADSAPTRMMSIGGHKAPVVTVDWTTALDCSTCLTASLDGKINVATLLAQ